MISNLSYKESGIEWIGKIPKHWEVKKGKYIFKNVKRICGIEHEKYERLALTMKGVIKRSKDDSEGLQPKEFETYQILKKNELVFKLIDLENIKTSRVGYSEYEGIVSPVYIILQNDKQNNKFFYYFYLHLYYNNVFNILGGGVRSNLTARELLNNYVVVPPIHEQREIVNFLDEKVKQINNMLLIKEKQIELLNSAKQSLIDNVILQGLNSNIKLKDSPIKWMKKIPYHWEVKRAKYYFYEVDERSSTGEEELLSVSHITGVTPRSEKNINMFLAESYIGYKLCSPNDIVCNIMWAWAGGIGVSKHHGIVSSSYGVYRLRNTELFIPSYLDYLLRTKAYIAEYTVRSKGIHSSRLRLYSDNFFDIPIICPPLHEQKEIVIYLRSEIDKIENYIRTIESQIALIQDYKKKLITEAVMGRIAILDLEQKRSNEDVYGYVGTGN
ncbi:restriction endonuclease subunit S [Aneurinibacillus danicus]|uniref:Type I restriction endonuclease subunit S n=1 Tax=Aneurinibacillus danicus TaxID=267746 RepID=A0A511VGD0_9BACL|nr:restriction endonuclease subunit S [Aneurinibacillus danicus]GEN36603.1 type I restriction endonuclease subunit S [Aneurinibacillus danicus]